MFPALTLSQMSSAASGASTTPFPPFQEPPQLAYGKPLVASTWRLLARFTAIPFTRFSLQVGLLTPLRREARTSGPACLKSKLFRFAVIVVYRELIERVAVQLYACGSDFLLLFHLYVFFLVAC
jgi:hypothetical protein